MIDPRISLAVQAPNAAPAINIFENALMNAQTRDIRNQQAQRAAELQPFQVQQAQQNVDINQQNINQNREAQRLQNIHQTGQRLKPFLEANDAQGAQQFLLNNISEIQTRIEQGSGEDITESMEALAKLQANDIQGVLNDVNAVEGLVTGGKGQNAIQSSQFIPGKGFATITKGGDANLVSVSGVGETSEEKRTKDIEGRASTEQLKASLQGKTSAVKAAVTKGSQAFDKLQPLSTAISNYDEAIAAIDSGAQTGVVASLLPSFKKASIELDNVVKRLGLDVVGSTTFGALSESELKFALKAAIPDNLKPADLKVWLIAKRDAQKKVKERVEEAASFLSDGTHTLKDWIEFDQAKQIVNKNQQEVDTAITQEVAADESPAAAAVADISANNVDVPDSGDQGVIMTDANGNRARVFSNGTFKELP